MIQDGLFNDMKAMHDKFKIHQIIENMSKETLKRFLEFRVKTQIKEEYDEIAYAIDNNDPEEVVDGLIDIVVFAIGTLDLMKVDGQKAWNDVYAANLNKNVGIKEGRPNPFGLPDLLKPKGWVAPSHEGNHGLLTLALS